MRHLRDSGIAISGSKQKRQLTVPNHILKILPFVKALQSLRHAHLAGFLTMSVYHRPIFFYRMLRTRIMPLHIFPNLPLCYTLTPSEDRRRLGN